MKMKYQVVIVFIVIIIGFLSGSIISSFFIPFPSDIIVSTNNTTCLGCD